MAKRVISNVDINDMIAGGHPSDSYSEYHKELLSGLSTVNSEDTKPQPPTFSTEPEPETGEHPEEPAGTLKRTDKKYRRTSLDEYRQTFLQIPRLTDRKPVFVSASTRERLDRIVRQLGDRKMSVSGLIENLALNHLKTYQEDIEQWRKL